MAIRPVYSIAENMPYVSAENIEFTYFPGFSIEQKRKSISSLHMAFSNIHSDARILEVSSKSETTLGRKLSAFNLTFHYSENQICTVESAFQSSKAFEKAGQAEDLLFKSSLHAKTDPRIHIKDDSLQCFSFKGQKYPLEPKTCFYEWLFLKGIAELPDEEKNLLATYTSFTDIEFNPKKSINCQARAAAIAVGIMKSPLLKGLDALTEDFERFKDFVYGPTKLQADLSAESKNAEYGQMKLEGF